MMFNKDLIILFLFVLFVVAILSKPILLKSRMGKLLVVLILILFTNFSKLYGLILVIIFIGIYQNLDLTLYGLQEGMTGHELYSQSIKFPLMFENIQPDENISINDTTTIINSDITDEKNTPNIENSDITDDINSINNTENAIDDKEEGFSILDLLHIEDTLQPKQSNSVLFGM